MRHRRLKTTEPTKNHFNFNNDMKQLATLLLVLVAFASQAQTTCVDPLACNFTESGECFYVDENGDLCVVEGCNIEGACNYDPEADLNDGSCDFESCLGCTDETACNFDPEALYLDNSCIYYIDCNGTCGGDWIQDECGNCYSPTFYEDWAIELTSCGATGAYGPSQTECDQVYGQGVVESADGIQELEIPYSGLYLFEVSGAGQFGALGAKVSGQLTFSEGDIIRVLIGQMGLMSEACGHGGTFVASSTNVPLIVAGGGAGVSDVSNNSTNASLSECGNDGNLGTGGCSGNGGDASEANHNFGGGGGGGFYTDGDDIGGWSDGDAGSAFINGGNGGVVGSRFGGFGGGGSGIHNNEPAGGGGYSGGGGGGCDCGGAIQTGGRFAGGGGSYLSALAVEGSVELNPVQGAGFCRITLLEGGTTPLCELGCTTLQACNYNEDATNDDGTCDFCFCGPGTEYSVEAGQCLVVEGCTDFNDDGCTGTQDLLHLLSNFGNCDE